MRISVIAQGTAVLAVFAAACSEVRPADEPGTEDAAAPDNVAATRAAPSGPRPVMLSGAGENLDPCAFAMIADAPTGAEQGAVMVFGAATTDLDFIDTLMHEDKVWVCEQSGDMLGIVYPPDGEMDCALSSPVPADRPYRGPCQQGWVKAEYVKVIAG